MSTSASSPTHVSLDFGQQQVGFRQKQRFRNPEDDRGDLSSPSGTHIKKPNGSPQHHGTSQIYGEKQNDGQNPKYNRQNPSQQAYYHPYYAVQQKSLASNQVQKQSKTDMPNLSGRENDTHIHTNDKKMQRLTSLQTSSQSQVSLTKKSAEQSSDVDRHTRNMPGDQKGESNFPQTGVGQFVPSHMARSGLTMQSQITSLSNNSNKQVAMVQLQAIHNWASENGIELSLPGNVNLISQLMPLQSRPSDVQKFDKNNIVVNEKKHQAMSSLVGNTNAAYENFMGSSSGHPGISKNNQSPQVGLISTIPGKNNEENTSNIQMHQQFIVKNSRENQNDGVFTRNSMFMGNFVPVMHSSQHYDVINNTVEHTNLKNPPKASETHHNQHARELQQFDQSVSQSSTNKNQSSGQVKHVQIPQKLVGFTKQQEHVLKAQILAFRRLKIIIQTGQGAIPDEILRAIGPPPLDLQVHQKLSVSKENMNPSKANNIVLQSAMVKSQSIPKEGAHACEETAIRESPLSGIITPFSEQDSIRSINKTQHNISTKSVAENECAKQKNFNKCDPDAIRGMIQTFQSTTTTDSEKAMVYLSSSNLTAKDGCSKIKYHGPIFDFPSFMRRHESSGSKSENDTNFVLSNAIDELVYEESTKVLTKKREVNLRKVGYLLAMNLERKTIKPDLALRLQIEEKKLRLSNYQVHIRNEVERQQKEIMAMPDRSYRKFVKQCERQRIELLRQTQLSQKVLREKKLKSIFQWRKKLFEAHWAIRDARTTRNRGVAKYHEKMLKGFSKRKDYDRNKRIEALQNNDVDRYSEILVEQQTYISSDAAQRYSILSSFLTQTEEYLSKLGEKITAAKNYQEVEEASSAAAASARSQGLLEEEVKAASACAGEEAMIRNRFSEMNASMEKSSINKYYNLAHTVNERVVQQPSMLRTGTLKDYQLVGLQWMLSLYNNKINGILADEMGLGKTVQVMALIAHLMEYKGNYGPHLIVVPNAVLVNWKTELHDWLPSVSCIFYVGGKDHRSKLFSYEVCAMKFNILVTTYEFVMYDRSKLSKIDWKYIIIDEAQRMKNRESVLARDLDRYRCQRRLLLTGTPLQNDLKELWSLLNLLLPEVFDNRKAFHDWFSKPFQKDGQSLQDQEEDDWLETEKKVIVIHRLHQILEPFMLRRRVQDVEGSLPKKVSIVLRCRMSSMQSSIYDWIKSTGTFRVDPEDELRKVQKNPSYQVKTYKNLSNKCMELRKVCNHPLLNYPYFNDYSKDFLVRSCGKLWILDRILIKLHRAGHHVLLFSTMTKLLDILEEYLQWRHLAYRRIDGSTTLDDRESAIVDFNNPDSDCFIFLLSIRAAGRGLNLQTADTVVIYDPDSNPQNEEQAVARAHRIGQKREVKVIYMQAVVDKMTSYQKEDQLQSGGIVDSEDDLAGKDRYVGTIEGLIRNNIQQCKIDMADEVINAGRFDQRTTHEERRMTLETLLHDEERYQETLHDVPSLQEVNRMIARSDQEIKLFDQMDEEFNWTGDMMKYHQVPKWLRASSKEIEIVVASLSKSSRNFTTVNIHLEPKKTSTEASPNKIERRRCRPRSSSNKRCIYTELEDEDVDDSDLSSLQEEWEIGENENDERTKDEFKEDLVGHDLTSGFLQTLNRRRNNNLFEEADSGSSGNFQMHQLETPSLALRKFKSFSSIEPRSDDGILNRLGPVEAHKGGENAVSGDSHIDFPCSHISDHDYDDGHVVQPKLKRKRSIRFRSKHVSENTEATSPKPRSLYGTQFPLKEEHSKGSYLKAARPHGQIFIDIKPFDLIQRKCKNIINKFRRRVDNDGPNIVPVIFDFWKNSPISVMKRLLDPMNIHHRVEGFKYKGLSDFISDVQLMLRNSVQHFGYSYEVSSEAKKLEDLFFDIMKVSFPDTDFHAVRDVANFSVPVVSVRTSRHNPITTTEGMQSQIHTSKLSRVTVAAKSNSNGNQSGSLYPTRISNHPGDLVICRGKRKDRERSRNTRIPFQKDGQQAMHCAGWVRQQTLDVCEGSLSPELQWGKPAKRMRTNTSNNNKRKSR